MEFSYIAVITSEDYLPGLKVLHKSLFDVNPIYPLSVLVADDISVGFLSKIQSIVGKSNIIMMPKIDINISINNEKYSHWKDTFFKLNAARLVRFKKIVLLDLDLLILKNIDDLFKWPHLSAATAGKISNPDWDMFNSGVLVLEPSISYFNLLLSLIAPTIKKCGTTIGDQDIFQASIPEWEDRKELHLPETYNEYYRSAKKLALHLNNGWKDIKVLHFWGRKKPWQYTRIEILKFYLKNILIKRYDLNKCFRLYRKRL